MKKIFKQSLLAVVSFTLILQSCTRDNPDFPNQLQNKLLLSQVTGQFTDQYFWGLNNSMYNQAGNFLETYSYGNSVRHGYKPLQQIGFINTGNWNFTFNNQLLPDQTTDNSQPGIDQGYWKYYYGRNGLIEKTGLAFSTAAQPTQFEFYTYDNNFNLTSLLYGTAIDAPFFKVDYYYDNRGNLDSFKYYVSVADATTRMNNTHAGKPAMVPALKNAGTFTESKIAQIQKGAIRNTAPGNFENRPSTNAAAGSSITYELQLTAKIKTDNQINPFSQQGRLLFYQTNRYFTFNLLDFYTSLLKHNPVSVSYTLAPEFGVSEATDIFTYTYNRLGYPVTLHQERTDPDFLESYNYTQDKQLTYIRNDD